MNKITIDKDYDNRKEFLENYDLQTLLDIIGSYEDTKPVKTLLIEHIIDKNYDLKWRAK